jgi:hypothetical protein
MRANKMEEKMMYEHFHKVWILKVERRDVRQIFHYLPPPCSLGVSFVRRRIYNIVSCTEQHTVEYGQWEFFILCIIKLKAQQTQATGQKETKILKDTAF